MFYFLRLLFLLNFVPKLYWDEQNQIKYSEEEKEITYSTRDVWH